MANSKIFRKAQERSAKGGSSLSGFTGFKEAIELIKDTQIRNVEPYQLLAKIAKDLKVKREDLYVKILGSDTRGLIKMMVAIGKNKDHAANSKQFMVVGNLLKNEIVAIKSVATTASRSAQQEKNKKSTDTAEEKTKTVNRGKHSLSTEREKSRRSRRKNRKPTRRSKLIPGRSRTPASKAKERYLRKKIKLKDKVVVEDFTSMAQQPASFNESVSAVPPKDFSSIYEDSNNKLYVDGDSDEIQIDDPGGIPKFAGLGVDLDRPSFIASTEISPIITDAELDVFEQVLMDRKFRIETVFQNLENIETEDIEALQETLAEFTSLSQTAMRSILNVATLDDKIVTEISTDMLDLANSLQYDTSDRITKIYAQALYDIANAPLIGVYETSAGQRKNNTEKNNLNYSTSASTIQFTGRNIYGNVLRSSGFIEAKDPGNYSFGTEGSLLATSVINDTRQKEQVSNLGNTGIRLSTLPDETTDLLDSLFYELALSRLIHEGDTNITSLKEIDKKNISSILFGQFGDGRTSLNEVSVPKDLAAIMKFSFGGKTYYPFEQFVGSDSGLAGRTFLDAVVQPAIGSIIEDTDQNFEILDEWIKNSDSSFQKFKQYIDAFHLAGGAPVFINEITNAIISIVVTPTVKIGPRYHPLQNELGLTNSQLATSFDSQSDFSTLDIVLKTIGENTAQALGHIYNTFGYCNFEGQSNLLYRISNASNQSSTARENFKNSVNSLEIGFSRGAQGGWSHDKDRNTNALEYALRNVSAKMSQLLKLIENNIMVSIELLLSDLGLIEAVSTVDYNADASSRFFSQKTIGETGDRYAASKFGDLPHFYLRTLIARCVHNIVSETELLQIEDLAVGETGTTEDIAVSFMKAAKVAVTNTNPDEGPVRWKVTRGQWPPESGDTEELLESVYKNFVPSEVQSAREGELDIEIDADVDGTVESININDPTSGFEFIDAVDGFCPLTLMLEGEDNSLDGLTFVKAKRGIFDNVYDSIVNKRSHINKMIAFIKKPIEAYRNFPDDLESAVGNISLDSIKEVAKIPAIDGQELVKFTSAAQVKNMEKAFLRESPSASLRYLPNKHIVSDTEFNAARRFLSKYLEDNLNAKQKAVIHTVGIPTGLLSSLNLSSEKFSLTRTAEYMLFGDKEFSQKLNMFHPDVYMFAGSFSNASDNGSITEILQQSKYFVTNRGFLSFDEMRGALDLNLADANVIATNHCLDYAIKLCLKITTGMDMDEDTFRVTKDANNLFVSDDGQKNIEALIKRVPDGFDTIFNKDGVDNINTIMKKLSDSTATEVNTYLASLECRLITPEDMVKKIIAPRIFDRVFSIIAHPDFHYTTESGPGLTAVTANFDGENKVGVFQIDLSEKESTDLMKNNHFAKYLYKVEKR